MIIMIIATLFVVIIFAFTKPKLDAIIAEPDKEIDLSGVVEKMMISVEVDSAGNLVGCGSFPGSELSKCREATKAELKRFLERAKKEVE